MSNLIPYKSLPTAGRGAGKNENALDLVYNFLNEQELAGLSKLALGGTFSVKDFQLGIGCFAKQFWYCYDAKQKDPRQQVYLALEDSYRGWPRKIKKGDIPKKPESAKTLVKPSTPFVFDDSKYDRTDKNQVDQFIRDHTDQDQPSVKVAVNNVTKFGRAFVSKFGGRRKKSGYCYFPFGYFENHEPESGRHFIEEFLQQGDVQHVRYYFGLSNSKEYFPNRIRILLFPVTGGKKVLMLRDGGGTILEKSTPPPPPPYE